MLGISKRLGIVLCCAALAATLSYSAAGAALRSDLGPGPGLRAELAVRELALSSDTQIAPAEIEPGPAGAGIVVAGEKNPLVAMLLSFAVPGLGEIYAGSTDRGKAFIAAEAGIWAGYAAFKLQESMRIDDYKEYAGLFADVSGDPGSGYYADIADYIRSEGLDSYNEALRAEARSLYPDDLAAQEDYVTEHEYSGDLAWEWDSETRFDKYRDLRHDASVSERNAFYMTGLAVLNRAISGVDSAFLVRRLNSGAEGEPVARLSLKPEFAEDGSCGGRATFEFTF